VRLVTINGKLVVDNGALVPFSEADAIAEAERQRALLLQRAGFTSAP
jgi:hypothetical protein